MRSASSISLLSALLLLAFAAPGAGRHARRTRAGTRTTRSTGTWRSRSTRRRRSSRTAATPPRPRSSPARSCGPPAGTANIELPAYLAPFGYAVGLLQPGLNELPVKVWIAISATNTKERVQVVGPFDVIARTTITVDPADDNRFLSATPWQYTAPAIPALDVDRARRRRRLRPGRGRQPPAAAGRHRRRQCAR